MQNWCSVNECWLDRKIKEGVALFLPFSSLSSSCSPVHKCVCKVESRFKAEFTVSKGAPKQVAASEPWTVPPKCHHAQAELISALPFVSPGLEELKGRALSPGHGSHWLPDYETWGSGVGGVGGVASQEVPGGPWKSWVWREGSSRSPAVDQTQCASCCLRQLSERTRGPNGHKPCCHWEHLTFMGWVADAQGPNIPF